MTEVNYHEKYLRDPEVNKLAQAIVEDFKETPESDKKLAMQEIVNGGAGQYNASLTYAYQQAAVELAMPENPKAPTPENKLVYDAIMDRWMTPVGLPESGKKLTKQLVEDNVSYAVRDTVNELENNDHKFNKKLKHFIGAKASILETPRVSDVSVSQNMERNVFKEAKHKNKHIVTL